MGNEQDLKGTKNPGANSTTKGIDLSKLRLSQDFASMAGVKKLLTVVQVHKPGSQDFIRVHPGQEWCLETAVLEDKLNRETYLVGQDLWPVLTNELIPKILFTTINRQGILLLWPIRLADKDGRLNPWHQSALDAVEKAKKSWVRVVANQSLGAYEILEAADTIPDPTWPDITFEEIINIAFKDRFICDFDHPVLRGLRGEV